MSEQANLMTPGHAPTPYSAAEIREGCPVGREIVLLIEHGSEAPAVQTIRFLTAGEEGAEQETQTSRANGEPHGEAQRSTSTWDQLQAHASYPESATSIEEVDLDIQAGSFRCLRYTVTDGTTVSTFWFAKTLPGMPVKVTTVEDGDLKFRMTMLGNTQPRT